MLRVVKQVLSFRQDTMYSRSCVRVGRGELEGRKHGWPQCSGNGVPGLLVLLRRSKARRLHKHLASTHNAFILAGLVLL